MLREGVKSLDEGKKKTVLLGEGRVSMRQYELLAEMVHGGGLLLLPLEFMFFLSSLKDGFHNINSYHNQDGIPHSVRRW
jgi:hypothetical protein